MPSCPRWCFAANYNVGMPGCEVPAAIGSSRLDDDRTTLGRGNCIERPLASEVFPLEVDRMNLGRVGKDHVALWLKDCVFGPAFPEPFAQLHVFVGDGVAFILQR